jgi:integrase
VVQFEALARQGAAISPHPLRHGLAYRMWKTTTPTVIMQILEHSRVAPTLRYGKPTEDDLRATLEAASRMR